MLSLPYSRYSSVLLAFLQNLYTTGYYTHSEFHVCLVLSTRDSEFCICSSCSNLNCILVWLQIGPFGRLTVMVMDLYFLVYLNAPYQMHISGILDRVSGARMQGMGVCLT